MAGLTRDTKDIVIFEPLLIDILDDNINEQQARILTLMFKLGGYTTLNVLTKLIGIAQPTVSIRVDEIVKKGYIRKNAELMPMALVLLLSPDNLEIKLKRKIEAQRNAAKFLQKVSDIRNRQPIENPFIKAIQVLYYREELLAKMIAFVYLHQPISRNELYQLIDPKKRILNSKEDEREKRKKDILLDFHHDIFHVIYKKYQKKEMFIRPRLPLDLFVKHRLNYLESLNSYFQKLLEKLSTFMSEEYESIIPHQFLQYPSELKLRIETCLKHYSTIRIIDNSVYQRGDNSNGVVGLISKRKNFSSNHKVMILSSKNTKLPKTSNISQYETHPLKGPIIRDYIRRDFIIFNNHGCLVFPPQPNSIPYYSIAPRFTMNLLEIFNSKWMNDHAS